ncbi:MAG: hypothetical protein QFF03_09785 [Pseudomonadota bacterium]|nr:hypothetical protein [Pseudomonadota bacterium]
METTQTEAVSGDDSLAQQRDSQVWTDPAWLGHGDDGCTHGEGD